MAKPPEAPSLGDLRKEIDRIDEAMHQLLMERGEIIDRLIAVKRSQETGSAFRPVREAEMMRRLVKRHKGILPLDTVESIWRVIISTFTYVQAPFSVHADLSAGDALMRDSARFHFGFTVPFVPHMGAAGVVAAVSTSKGDLGLVPAIAVAGAGAWWSARRLRGQQRGGRVLDLHALEELLVVLEHLFERRRGVVHEVRRGSADSAQVRDVHVLDVAGATGGRVAGEEQAARIRCRDSGDAGGLGAGAAARGAARRNAAVRDLVGPHVLHLARAARRKRSAVS